MDARSTAKKIRYRIKIWPLVRGQGNVLIRILIELITCIKLITQQAAVEFWDIRKINNVHRNFTRPNWCSTINSHNFSSVALIHHQLCLDLYELSALILSNGKPNSMSSSYQSRYFACSQEIVKMRCSLFLGA